MHASEALHEALGEARMAPPERLVRMRDEGRLGRKTGEGFFRYDYGRTSAASSASSGRPPPAPPRLPPREDAADELGVEDESASSAPVTTGTATSERTFSSVVM